MTGKESFLLLENKIIFNSKKYKQDCEFVNLKTGQRINCKYAIAQVEKELEWVESIKKNDGIAKKLNQLEKIKEIIGETNYKIGEATDTVLVRFLMTKVFNELKEVFKNE